MDRGFRDCVNAMEHLGLDVDFPPFLNSHRQFTASAANQSRFVSTIRWIVEAVNAQITQFKFLANIVQNTSLPHLPQYLSSVCSIINRYWPPIKHSNVEHTVIVDEMNIITKSEDVRRGKPTCYLILLISLYTLSLQSLQKNNSKKKLFEMGNNRSF